MNIDKKSIIQIAILVILVVGAGVFYLTTQEGGLGFITDLLPGDAKQAEPVASTAKPEPAIPAQLAKGQVNGVTFEPDAVLLLEGGVLEFVQSKQPQTAIQIRLVTTEWETPVGKKFKYLPATGANVPVVTVKHIEGSETKAQTFIDKYTLLLEFGQEKERKLSGKLHLTVAGNITLAGTFDADILGFRIVEGKPDLTADSPGTLQFLALKEVLKDDPDKQIEVIAFRDGRLHSDASEKNKTGYIEIEYKLAQANAEIKRFQLVKDPEWKVRSALKLNEIDEAHPIVAPGPKDKPERVLSYLAAKRLEADVKKKSPNKGIYGLNLVTRANTKNKIGVAETSYKLEPTSEVVRTAYLFRLKPNGWALERELNAKEKVNVDNGKIEKR